MVVTRWSFVAAVVVLLLPAVSSFALSSAEREALQRKAERLEQAGDCEGLLALHQPGYSVEHAHRSCLLKRANEAQAAGDCSGWLVLGERFPSSRGYYTRQHQQCLTGQAREMAAEGNCDGWLALPEDAGAYPYSVCEAERRENAGDCDGWRALVEDSRYTSAHRNCLTRQAREMEKAGDCGGWRALPEDPSRERGLRECLTRQARETEKAGDCDGWLALLEDSRHGESHRRCQREQAEKAEGAGDCSRWLSVDEEEHARCEGARVWRVEAPARRKARWAERGGDCSGWLGLPESAYRERQYARCQESQPGILGQLFGDSDPCTSGIMADMVEGGIENLQSCRTVRPFCAQVMKQGLSIVFGDSRAKRELEAQKEGLEIVKIYDSCVAKHTLPGFVEVLVIECLAKAEEMHGCVVD